MVKLVKIKNLKKIMSCLTALPARPPLPCPYGHNTMGYSQTCLKGSAQGTGENWLLKIGDPLIQVHFHYNLVQRIPKKSGWLRHVTPSFRDRFNCTFISIFFMGRNFTCSHCKNDKWDKGIMEAHPKVFCVNMTAVNCMRWHNDNVSLIVIN